MSVIYTYTGAARHRSYVTSVPGSKYEKSAMVFGLPADNELRLAV